MNDRILGSVVWGTIFLCCILFWGAVINKAVRLAADAAYQSSLD